MWSNVVVVDPSEVSVVTISSTISSFAELTVFTVNVELLFVVPVTVIRSLTAKPLSAVLALVILYSEPVAVKLMSVPVTFAMCDFDASSVVLVCAIVVIYSVFFLLNLAVFGPSPYTAANSLGSCPSTVSMLMYLIL